MMANMKPEDMERMSQMAAGMGMAGGGMPAGMPAFSPEMMRQASGMMANMKPEDMRRMQEMAASMGMGGGGTPSGEQ